VLVMVNESRVQYPYVDVMYGAFDVRENLVSWLPFWWVRVSSFVMLPSKRTRHAVCAVRVTRLIRLLLVLGNINHGLEYHTNSYRILWITNHVACFFFFFFFSF